MAQLSDKLSLTTNHLHSSPVRWHRAHAGRLNILGRPWHSLSVDYTLLDFCPPPSLRSGRQRVEVLDWRKTLEQQRQLYGTSYLHESEYGVELLARCPRRPQKHYSLGEALLRFELQTQRLGIAVISLSWTYFRVWTIFKS